MSTDAAAFAAQGFNVIADDNLTIQDFAAILADSCTYGWWHIGHGAIGQLKLADGTYFSIRSEKSAQLDHKWALVTLVVCQAAYESQTTSLKSLAWADLVSPHGKLKATIELINYEQPVPNWPLDRDPGRPPDPPKFGK